MSEQVTLTFADGKSIQLPVVVGTEGEKAIDIRKLRNETGYITLDPGFVNTGACTSSITYLDGEQGILRYRGIPIEQLAEKSNFMEVCYLLIHGHLPTREELKRFSSRMSNHAMIHEDMKHFFDNFSSSAHPMAILSAMVASMTAYYADDTGEVNLDLLDINTARLLSKIRTIAAFSYKKSIGQPFIYPMDNRSYCANFLRMMFAVPAEEYEVDPLKVEVLNLLLMLHADHEQNCSTTAVRLAGSSRSNLFASVAAGILALWGPLHGGANQAVIGMLNRIHKEGGNVAKYVEMAKDKNSSFKLMGFGHRVYKNYDPRAAIVKKACDRLLTKLGIQDPILDIAKTLEETALQDEYFVSRKLYPNVDFYSGIIYRALNIPTDMFTVMFVLGRLPGWIAQWREMHMSADNRISRPRQIYTGETVHDYVPIDQRK